MSLKLPQQFTTYVHGSEEDESKYDLIKNLGIKDDSYEDLQSSIIYCDYEVELTWEIGLDEEVRLIK